MNDSRHKVLKLARSGSLPQAWAAISAEAIERLDDPDLPEVLVRALETVLPFDCIHQNVYQHNARPINVYSSPGADQGGGLSNFIKSTYELNPFYRQMKMGLPTGAYRAGDFNELQTYDGSELRRYEAVAMPSEEVGYLTNGWPAGQRELFIAVQMPDRQYLEIAPARVMRGFSAKDVATVTPVVPFLAACFRRYWKSSRTAEVSIKNSAPNNSVLAALSRREREVSELVLRGHSTLSISLRLAISTTTVKTHRKHIYAKLGISTQAELFALALTA